MGNSVHWKENYIDLSLILEKVNYQEHKWIVCRYFKILIMLLGQQADYKKIPGSFACETVELKTSIEQKLTGFFEVP